MRRFLIVLLLVGGYGCDRQERAARPADPEAPMSPEKLAEALGKDAAELRNPADPPPSAADLKGDLQHFTTIDACVAERAGIDAVVGDALLAIGYDTFLRDACRVIDATKARDPRRCGSIEASSLRARCEASVAMVTGNPDACPFDVASDPTRGRDATCVAVAARDARLCAGESTTPKRSSCEALLSGDEKKCAEAQRRTCARDAARWKSVLAEVPPAAGPALAAPKGTLSIDGMEGGRSSTDLSLDIGRGVVLARELGAVRLRIGSLQEVGAIPRAASAVANPRIGFELRFMGEAPNDARIEKLELDVPGGLTIVAPPARTALKARVLKLDKFRGGEVTVLVEGTATSGTRNVTVRAEMTTFVRDVVGR